MKPSRDAPESRPLVDGDNGRQSRSQLPQAIAHRGYNVLFPENTMAAFRAAVEVGAHGIETDIRLTKDGVVVLSHDDSLKRCFGVDRKIQDCEWREISDMRTTSRPHEPMPRLLDLLVYLSTLRDTWVLLDIKPQNPPDVVLAGIAAAIREAPQAAWTERVVLGCWNSRYLTLCRDVYFQEYRLAYIGMSLWFARRFLSTPSVEFNMNKTTLAGPRGRRFMADCKAAQRRIHVWTVNEPEWMRWCIKTGVDSVLTDDPRKYLEVRRDFEADPGGKTRGLESTRPKGGGYSRLGETHGSLRAKLHRMRTKGLAFVTFVVLNLLVTLLEFVQQVWELFSDKQLLW